MSGAKSPPYSLVLSYASRPSPPERQSTSEVSLSDLYPINHDALLVVGQLKTGSKMRTLGTILDTEVLLQPQCFTKRELYKRSMKREVLAICKYANLGSGNAMPLHSIISSLCNKHELRWLRFKLSTSAIQILKRCSSETST